MVLAGAGGTLHPGIVQGERLMFDELGIIGHRCGGKRQQQSQQQKNEPAHENPFLSVKIEQTGESPPFFYAIGSKSAAAVFA